MSDENDDGSMPPPPPGLPPLPPAPPGMDDVPPAPPGMDDAPPAPPAPPGMDDVPPAPPGMDDVPPAPPEMDALLSPPEISEESTEDTDDSLGDPMDLLGDDTAVESPPFATDVDLLGGEPEIEPHEDGEEEISEDDTPVVSAPLTDGIRVRSVSDVDAIPGDKIVATLSEVEASLLSPDGDVVKQDVSGVLALNNPSGKDRLWDIEVNVYGSDHSDITSELPFSELEAGSEQSVEYGVEGPRMLRVVERIDTNPSRNQERSLSVVRDSEAQEIHLEIEVENVGPVQLNDVVVTRSFPVEIQVGDSEEYDKQGDMLTWNVSRLSAGEKRTLIVPTAVTAEAIDSIEAGSAHATYSAEATLSGMGLEGVDALCRGFSYMVVDEDERPDNYRCQAVFENRSSFAVDLTTLLVQQTGADSPLFDVSDVPDDVLPDGRWESDVEVVHSTDKPTFSQELLYSVIPRVSMSTEGTIDLQPHVIEVLEAEISKDYSVDVLRHYRETDLVATMEISNTGSATINLLRITDDVPGIFASPDIESVKASIDGNELVKDQFRIELKEGISLEENRISPDGIGNTMLITIGTKGPIGLAPGRKMTITYPLVAPDPSPANDVVAAPARIDFSAERFGPVATRGLNVVPAVRVTHRKVNYDSGKEVFPAGGAGRYEAMIMFNNRADSALKDVVIHDIIPGAFELLEWSVTSSTGEKVKAKMKEEAIKDGKKISWTIGTVSRGERIEVLYEFKGDSGTGFKVSDAQEVHGIDVGAEVEEELPPIEDEPEPEEEEVLPENSEEVEDTDSEEESAEDDSVEESAEEAEDGGDDLANEVEETPDSEVEDSEEESEDVSPDAESDDAEEAAMDDALALITGNSTQPDSGNGSEDAEESVEEPSNTDAWTCPICSHDNAAGLTECSVCSFSNA